MTMEVAVRVQVHPTESREKVELAVRNVLGDFPLAASVAGDTTVLEGSAKGLESLSHLREVFRRNRIREAARGLLSRVSGEGALSFGLNKQAAFMGRASFYTSGESSLGPIQVTIHGDASRAVNFLCG